MTNTASLAWAAEWANARCLGLDTETFFIPNEKITRSQKAKRVYEAKQICRQCPIRQQCLKYALDHEILSGVWGGVSEEDRVQLLKFRTGRPKPVGTRP